jgi:beta-glucanase (GH16 family)
MNFYIIKIYLFILIAVLMFGSICFAQQWQLVWSDEFDGNAVNDSNWTHEIGGNGWGNNELQYYTDRDINSYVSNGYLVIQALKENYSAWNYTSARLKSQGKKFFKYGKILARIKLPYGQGIWPAFWMLGESFPIVGWPDCGEIDIVELVGGPTGDNTVYGTAHWEEANGQHAQYSNSYTLSSGIFADNFHLFWITWDEQKIKWYVDNHLYHEIDITPSSLSEFHEDFFIILNVAVGGNWPGPPDSTTVFPQRMEVDYIKVYKDLPSLVEDGSNIPIKFNLCQNYPNPFNNSTVIKYSIAQEGLLTLKIYNIMGEEIAVLVEEFKQAGSYQVAFTTEQLTSGIYFYKLNSGSFFQTRKMILLK